MSPPVHKGVFMNFLDSQKKEIVERLKPLNPKRIIMFGSNAWGKPGKDSDIDIYVVTNDDYSPKNFSEKMGIKLKGLTVGSSLNDLNS